MYAIILQDETTHIVEKVIACATLTEVQNELDILEPNYSWEYLVNGDLHGVTVHKPETVDSKERYLIYHLAPLCENSINTANVTKQAANS